MRQHKKKRIRVEEGHVEYMGAITPFFKGEYKYVIVDGKKHMVPKNYFDGFKGSIRLFQLNHPLLYMYLMGCAVGLLICSVVGIIVIFAVIGFSKGSVQVFGGGALPTKYQGDSRGG